MILHQNFLYFGQIFSLLLRPNKQDNVLVNLETRGKNYTNNRDLCVKDSCRFSALFRNFARVNFNSSLDFHIFFSIFLILDVIIRNSELMCGSMDKSTLGSGTKSSIFYVILRDFGQEPSTKSMWRLARVRLDLITSR